MRGQFRPRLQRPRARGGAGRRGQHEDFGKIIALRLPAERDARRRPPIKQARGLLAGEGDGPRPIPPHLLDEPRDIDARLQRLMIHARAKLAHVGEADAEVEQRRKFMRLIEPRRDADRVDRAPEAVAGMRVIVAEVSGPLGGGGADEDEAEVGLELVGEAVHVGGARTSRVGQRSVTHRGENSMAGHASLTYLQARVSISAFWPGGPCGYIAVTLHQKRDSDNAFWKQTKNNSAGRPDHLRASQRSADQFHLLHSL